MEIKVRLFATLREGRGKEIYVDLSDSIDTNEIISKLDIPLKEVSILLINGLDGKLDRKLQVGDIVSIFPPVGGG